MDLKAGVKRFLRRVRRTAIWRSEDLALQWLWFVLNVEPERIGYGPGPLTWLRQRKHKKLRRRIHICLLEHNPEWKKEKHGELTVFWINERSSACSASLNEGIEDADILWIYCQDPLSPDIKAQLLRSLKRAKSGTPVINHPDTYNSYHEEGVFKRLEEAEVSVPRTKFTDSDVGKTWVVYKAEGRHTAPKTSSRYAGPRAGYRTFEFVDSREPAGLYRVYRAFYIAGNVYPTIIAYSKHWNVYLKTLIRREYTFRVTAAEARQIRLIAETLNLQFFAVDYLRREHDDLPVFVDINVYPGVMLRMIPLELKPIRRVAKVLGIRYFATDYLRREPHGRLVYLDVNAYPKNHPAESLRESGTNLGYYGQWLTFDRLELFGVTDPLEPPFWDTFDEAMVRLSQEHPPVQQSGNDG